MNSFPVETVSEAEMVTGTHQEGTEENMDTQSYEEQDGSTTNRVKEMTELEKYWQAVRDNPSDFTGWTYLLQYVEQENNLTAAREAFEAFFKNYPYCYGYWKKYADMEKKLNSSEKCKEVFEKGLEAIPLSVDLWIHYINFYKTYVKDEPDAYDKIKAVFDRSIQAAGREFRSDRLWDLYISWEQENNNLKAVTAIYDNVLTVPTQLYNHHFEKFREHVSSNLPKDILSTDEFLEFRQEYVATKQVKQDDVAPEEEDTSSDILPPGVEEEDVPPGMGLSDKTDKDTANTEETRFIRERVLEKRRAIHRQNEEEVSKRWAFEDGIKRPYFHVKPLERSQLKNWRDYLDFEIQNGNHERTVILFERCMIACALYEDMWMKYAAYMELQDVNAARDVYRRACTIHLPRKPNINLSWACFEERKGNHEESVNILTMLETSIPDFLEASLRKISVQRRQKKYEEVERLYKGYIETAKSARMASHFAAKFARFCYKVLGDYEKAAQVIEEALQKDPLNVNLYAQLIDIGFQKTPLDEEKIIAAFDQALNSELEDEQKLLFSQRKLEFVEDFVDNLQKLQETFEEYTKMAKNQGVSAKKRAGEFGDDASKEKKLRNDVNGVVSMNSAMQQNAATQQVVAASQATPAPPVQDSNAYAYQQSWGGYTQTPYNYQQTWSHYPASYYPSH